MPEQPWQSHCQRADALLDLGRAEEAFGQAKKALGLDIQQSEPWFEACRALLSLSRGEEALEHADAGLVRRPESAWGHRLRSSALSMRSRPTEALGEADEAMKLTPHEPLAMRRRARCLYALDRDEEALTQVDESIGTDPESHYGYGLRSAITLYLKRFDASETACRAGLELSPGNVELLSRLGDVLRKKGQPLDAMAAYRDAILANPTDPRPKKGMKAAMDALREPGGVKIVLVLFSVLVFILPVILVRSVLPKGLILVLWMSALTGGASLGVWLSEHWVVAKVRRRDPALWDLWLRVQSEQKQG